jgi:hypothetical protein
LCLIASPHVHQVELRFGVLYESYHCRYYYWECIVLVQKLVLILPVMLLQRKGQGLQVLLAMLVITGASILQVGVGGGWGSRDKAAGINPIALCINVALGAMHGHVCWLGAGNHTPPGGQSPACVLT